MKKVKIKFMTLTLVMLFAVAGAFGTIDAPEEPATAVYGFSAFLSLPCQFVTVCSDVPGQICMDINGQHAWGRMEVTDPTCDILVFSRPN